MVTAQLYGLGNMLSMVMGPRYGEKFGRSGDRREVARLAARASELQAAAMALPAALAIVAAPPLLAWLLPDYRTGLAPLVWLVPGVVALCVALPATQYLVAVDRQTRRPGRRADRTRSWRPWATTWRWPAATAWSAWPRRPRPATSSIACSSWPFRSGPSSTAPAGLRYLAMLALALAPTLGLAVALERLRPGVEAGRAMTLAKAAAVVLVWSATVADRLAPRRLARGDSSAAVKRGRIELERGS